MQGELRLRTLQLEGNLFRLNRKLDKEVNLNEYVKTKKEIEKTRMQLEQYRMCLDEFEKQKAIKRKMVRGLNE